MECYKFNLIIFSTTFLLFHIEAAEFQLTDKTFDIQGASADSYRSVPHPDVNNIAIAIIRRLLAEDDYNEKLSGNDRNENIEGKGIPAFLIDQIESIKQIFKPKPVIILKPLQKEDDDQKELSKKPANVQTSTTSQVIISNTIETNKTLSSQSEPISGDNGTLPILSNNQAQLANVVNLLAGSLSSTQPGVTPANSLWHILLYGFDNNKPVPTLSGIFSSALTSAINQYVINNGINNNEIFLQTIANLAGNKLANAVWNYIRNHFGYNHHDHHYHHVNTESNGQFTSNGNDNHLNQVNRQTDNSVNDNKITIPALGNAPTNYQLNNPVEENVLDFNSGSGSTSPLINAEIINYLLNLQSNENRLETGGNGRNPEQDQLTDSALEYNQSRNQQFNKISRNINSELDNKAKLIDYLLRLQSNGRFELGKGKNSVQNDEAESTVSESITMNGQSIFPALDIVPTNDQLTAPASVPIVMNTEPLAPASETVEINTQPTIPISENIETESAIIQSTVPSLETALTNDQSTPPTSATIAMNTQTPVPGSETLLTNTQSTVPASETSSTNSQSFVIASEIESTDGNYLNSTNPEITFDNMLIKLLSVLSEDFTKYILYSILFNQPIE